MMFSLDRKVALVTGAGRGMGLGVARALAVQGARVAINDFFPERAEAAMLALRQQGFDVCAAPGDITQPSVRQAIIDSVLAQLGPIDILVHNAGVPPGMENALRHFKALADEDFEKQLDLNLRAVTGLTKLVLDGMSDRGWGRIVIISSESWRIGLKFGLSNYAAAKAAALGFMRQLAHEVGRQGITVNAVSLGTMNNFGYDEIARNTTAVGRAGTPEDVGAAVAWLSSTEAAWYTGQTMALNGGSSTI